MANRGLKNNRCRHIGIYMAGPGITLAPVRQHMTAFADGIEAGERLAGNYAPILEDIVIHIVEFFVHARRFPAIR